MSRSKNKLISGQSLIYERTDGVTYARYRDPPLNKLPRWIVGGDPNAVSKAEGKLFGYDMWQKMMEEAETNTVLKKYLKKAVEAFYITKENK
jgi:hypothetical protein